MPQGQLPARGLLLNEAGTASGTLMVNGKSADMKLAYAYEQGSSEPDEIDIVMIVSDQELPAAALKDEDKLRDLSTQGKFNGVRVVVHQDRRVMSAEPFHPALTTYFSTALFVRWEATEFGEDGITAHLYTPDGEQNEFSQRWSYDIHYSTPVEVLDE